jgi:membrane protein DedA with SNARE-associated domain/membrane-associated phospholipid phosphatase
MMTTLDTALQPVLDLVGRHPAFAGLIVLLAALSEAVPVVGAVMPGSAIVIGVGALVGLGQVPLWPMLAAAVAGAIIGDGLSYGFGHRYKAHALAIWPMSRHPDMIATSERFFARHGAKSVVIARFTPVVRAFVPLIAGASGMRPGRFYTANVASALAWAPLHILLGAAVGASLGGLGAASGRTLVLLAAVVVAGIILAWLIRLAWQVGFSRLDRGQTWLFDRLRTRQGHWWGMLRGLIDPDNLAGRNVALLGTTLAAVIGVFNLTEDVLARGGEIARADAAVANLVTGLRTTWSDHILILVTTLADTPITAVVALIAAAWLWWLGRRHLAYGVVAVVGVTTLFALGLKATAHVPRPHPIYTGAVEFSFPSGHATFASAIYGVLGWLIAHDLDRPWRTLVLSAIGVGIATVAASRIYLGAHWPSDVTAGLLFGIGATAVFALVFRSVRLAPRERITTALIALGTVIVVGSWHVSHSYAFATARYTPAAPALTTLSEAEWRGGGWQSLPAYRVELGGDREDPLQLQWAGDTASLTAALRPYGWQPGPDLGLAMLDRFLTASTRPEDLPTLPKLNDGRAPDLVLVRPVSTNGREIMRVWTSRFTIARGTAPRPVLLASISREQVEHPLGIFTLSHKQEHPSIDTASLAGSLPHAALATRPPASVSGLNAATRATALATP